jgi:hypothetical protein
MPVSAQTIAAYAPWGNAQLTFKVGSGETTVDEATGNTVPLTLELSYLASLRISGPGWTGKPGSDETVYPCTGRLLSPDRLDKRITNGSQAEALVNGYRGRFELVFDLAMNREAYRDIRQSINGTFRVIGGPG